MAQIKFIRGTRDQYNALIANDAKKQDVINSVFFVTNEQVIMMGEKQYGGATGHLFDGFIKNLDVEGQTLKFNKSFEGQDTLVTIKLIEVADNSIVIGDITKGADGNSDGVKDGSTIKVNVKTIEEGDDGLKLGDDGLYVNLTKTTSSITANTKAIKDEVTRAKEAEKANAANIATNTAAIAKLNDDTATVGSVDNKIDTAIKGLDVNSIGGEGKFVKSVSETDGKIAAEVGDLVSSAVKRTSTTNVEGQVDMTGTTVEGALVDLAKAVSETKNDAATYKIAKVTTGLSENVMEAYQLVQTVNGKDTNIDVQIPIYKDQTLKSVELTDTDGKKKGQYLKYTYTTANGEDSVVYVDVSRFLVESEFKNGLSVSESGEVSVKIDATSEGFLTVGTGGVKLSGVTDAIDAAKTAIIGGATEEYNTLSKLEEKIQAVDAKASSAHTEVVAKADGHVTVSVEDSENGTHKVVTVGENDIASATALTDEEDRAQGAEDKIEASVGLATNGSHVKTTGNYTSGATTVVGEIAALDTQVKANADAIAANANTNLNLTEVGGTGKVITTVSQKNGQVSATAINLNSSAVTRTGTTNVEGQIDMTGTTVEAALSELATAIKDEASAREGADTTISGNVTTNTNAIATLNGEETADGSVKHTAKGYADTALTNANAYTDKALNWIDAGTYGTEA